MNDRMAQIALSGVPYHVDRLYSYAVPEELSAQVTAGVRVIVPFGRGNRRTEGFVLDAAPSAGQEKLKPILSVLDDKPLLSDALLRLVMWMKARYFCTVYDAVKTVLPSGIWFRYTELYRLKAGIDPDVVRAYRAANPIDALLLDALSAGEKTREKLEELCGAQTARRLKLLCERNVAESEVTAVRRLSDKSVKTVRLAVSAEDALAFAATKQKSAPLRYAVVQMLCTEGTVCSSDLCYYTGASMATLNALKKAGIVSFSQEESFRVPKQTERSDTEPIILSGEQESAYQGLLPLLQSGKPNVALLHGVTASGKTQVYLRLIEQTLAMGRTALLLVPEIALTPQVMAKVSARFGDRVAMLHSGLRLSERYDQWKRIRRGDVRLVLGTRSAIFAPLEDIGLIVMDEEQEGSYQSENPPRYHTRDIAQFRCAQSGALLLLGSATPTVETMYYAETGRYRKFTLQRRYNEKSLPDVLLADMRQELAEGNEGAIGRVLAQEIERNLDAGEQTILFLNRRGSSRMLLCVECGQTPECPRCSAPMTYHSANGRLMCHYCGHSEPAYERCRCCGGILKHIGIGTQKVEEELSERFPGVRTLRMDVDTVGASGRHQKLLDTFSRENVPILLGTQMVAKGLDFENVTLVGALSADQSLYIDHFRAAERTFCLLSQVVGRAGRGGKQGRAVIQTYSTKNDVILAAAAQDYAAFYATELKMRSLRRYPPFADLFTLTVTGTTEQRVVQSCITLCAALRQAVGGAAVRELAPEVLGPAPAAVVRVNNRYRYHIFIVAQNTAAIRGLIREHLLAFPQHKENRGLDIFADCNALS